MKDWFVEWFDSPYYHQLYKHRDDTEAATFIHNLNTYLQLAPKSKVLDLACGRGRHAVHFHSLGYRVTGLDLSPQNIAFANQFSNEDLQFAVHDMRDIYKNNEYDVVLNLFTSFGYFNSSEEDLKVLSAVRQMLAPKGIFVFDYMNVTQVSQLNETVVKIIDDVKFVITKKREESSIIKEIRIEDKNVNYTFYEKVCGISYESFMSYFEESQFNIIDIFGTYSLLPFEETTSPRLIIIATPK